MQAMSSPPQPTATITLRERGQVTIPADVREAAHIEAGAVLECHVEEGRIVMTPKVLIDADQTWFWTRRWQTMEREADDDFARGRSASFDDVEGLLDDLES
jgi:AbrB family looped-hinge helix DNA binding protein